MPGQEGKLYALNWRKTVKKKRRPKGQQPSRSGWRPFKTRRRWHTTNGACLVLVLHNPPWRHLLLLQYRYQTRRATRQRVRGISLIQAATDSSMPVAALLGRPPVRN